MIKETYIFWEIKADNVIVRVIAPDVKEALKKAEEIYFAAEKYTIVTATEYWMPGVGYNQVKETVQMILEEREGQKAES